MLGTTGNGTNPPSTAGAAHASHREPGGEGDPSATFAVQHRWLAEQLASPWMRLSGTRVSTRSVIERVSTRSAEVEPELAVAEAAEALETGEEVRLQAGSAVAAVVPSTCDEPGLEHAEPSREHAEPSRDNAEPSRGGATGLRPAQQPLHRSATLESIRQGRRPPAVPKKPVRQMTMDWAAARGDLTVMPSVREVVQRLSVQIAAQLEEPPRPPTLPKPILR